MTCLPEADICHSPGGKSRSLFTVYLIAPCCRPSCALCRPICSLCEASCACCACVCCWRDVFWSTTSSYLDPETQPARSAGIAADAARAAGMDRQTLRDWMHRYNAVYGPSPLCKGFLGEAWHARCELLTCIRPSVGRTAAGLDG